MEEKENIVLQFRHVTGEKQLVDNVQAGLLQKLNEVKKTITDFDGRRNGLMACLLHYIRKMIPC